MCEHKEREVTDKKGDIWGKYKNCKNMDSEWGYYQIDPSQKQNRYAYTENSPKKRTLERKNEHQNLWGEKSSVMCIKWKAYESGYVMLKAIRGVRTQVFQIYESINTHTQDIQQILWGIKVKQPKQIIIKLLTIRWQVLEAVRK